MGSFLKACGRRDVQVFFSVSLGRTPHRLGCVGLKRLWIFPCQRMDMLENPFQHPHPSTPAPRATPHTSVLLQKVKTHADPQTCPLVSLSLHAFRSSPRRPNSPTVHARLQAGKHRDKSLDDFGTRPCCWGAFSCLERLLPPRWGTKTPWRWRMEMRMT